MIRWVVPTALFALLCHNLYQESRGAYGGTRVALRGVRVGAVRGASLACAAHGAARPMRDAGGRAEGTGASETKGGGGGWGGGPGGGGGAGDRGYVGDAARSGAFFFFCIGAGCSLHRIYLVDDAPPPHRAGFGSSSLTRSSATAETPPLPTKADIFFFPSFAT